MELLIVLLFVLLLLALLDVDGVREYSNTHRLIPFSIWLRAERSWATVAIAIAVVVARSVHRGRLPIVALLASPSEHCGCEIRRLARRFAVVRDVSRKTNAYEAFKQRIELVELYYPGISSLPVQRGNLEVADDADKIQGQEGIQMSLLDAKSHFTEHYSPKSVMSDAIAGKHTEEMTVAVDA